MKWRYVWCDECKVSRRYGDRCQHQTYEVVPEPVKTGNSPRWVYAVRARLCHYCGGPGGTVDHKVPRSKGGPNRPSNALPACVPCNGRKSNMSYEEFLEWRVTNDLKYRPSRRGGKK